ncbi:MAG: serine/threonine protein kinase [Acidobacteriota bacterium]|nr:serine/threonine protein kinase [Acidobacteriota bacterium]
MSESQKIGRYEIIEEKGRGAMGAVYIARDPAMGRVVALKTIHSIALTGPHAEEFRERFYREARSAGGLAHPGIVTVFDVGDQAGVPYLVMEYIEGRTLDDATKNGERFTFERVCEIGQQIAEALGYAHKNGVVHRDIKPANILMTSKEKYGIERPKITDFGVAKLGAAHLTTTGQMLGTPAFMPPEQFTGAPIDGRSDLFSLGVILYWMATGEHAFPGETVTAVSYKVVNTEPVPPRKLNPGVPTEFDEIVMKCLAKSPSDRYATGEDLARDLSTLRNSRSPATLHGTVPTAFAVHGDSSMDATLDSHPSATSPQQGAQRTNAAAQTPVSAKKGTRWAAAIIGALVLLLLLGGGWYGYTHRERIAEMLDGGGPPVTATETAANNAAPPVAKNRAQAKHDGRKENMSAQPGKTEIRSAETPKNSLVSAAVPVPPKVPFDPKQLDPGSNARMKIEAEHFPENVGFTVEMGGKIYFERSGGNNQNMFEDLYVPPGVTEFRVIAGVGANRKTSNIVSAEFKAKKKKTLRVELRTQGQKPGSGVPAGVYADSQIVVTLK